MKINWGLGIAISIIVFSIVTLLFVYFAFNQDVNLVREDYYEAELNFDNKMETLKRTKELSQELGIVVIPNFVEFTFPEVASKNKITGNILLYRPSDRNLDIELRINTDSLFKQRVSSNNLKKGIWKAQVAWYVDTLSYYSEKIIMVD